jgi:hypothetical protein
MPPHHRKSSWLTKNYKNN